MKIILLVGFTSALLACGGASTPSRDPNSASTGTAGPSTLGPNNLGAPAQASPPGLTSGTQNPNKTGGVEAP